MNNSIKTESALIWDGDFLIVNPFKTYEQNLSALNNANITEESKKHQLELLESLKKKGALERYNNMSECNRDLSRQDTRVKFVRPTENYELILLFENGETRIYDATRLFNYDEYKPLKNMNIFKSAKAAGEKVMWLDRFEVSCGKLYHGSAPTKLNIYSE